MRRSRGASLVEMLVSMSILVIVLGLATTGVVMALRAQRTQEAVTSSQSKLRRVNEAVTQELRSSVLGGLAQSPFSPSATQVSFTVLDGGAGYQVRSVSNSSVTFVASETSVGELAFGRETALLVNEDGVARVLNVQSIGGGAGNTFTLNHGTCTNSAFPVTADTLLFRIDTVGYEYDSATGTLYEQVNGDSKNPLAFDLSKFAISYVYTQDDGTVETRNAPYVDGNGNPLKNATDASGNPVTLQRLQLAMGTKAKSIAGRTVERTYTSQVDMIADVNSGGSSNRAIQGVTPCNNL